MIAEVPTMAIDMVEVQDNSTGPPYTTNTLTLFSLQARGEEGLTCSCTSSVSLLTAPVTTP